MSTKDKPDKEQAHKNTFPSKQIGKVFMESEEKYRSLFENAPDGISLLDAKGIIIDCNSKECEFLGYSCEEIIGKHITHFFRDEYKELFKKKFPILQKEGKVELELELKRKDGSFFPIERTATAFYDEEDNFSGVIVHTRDITNRKLVEKALRESEKKHRLLADHATDVISLHAFDGTFLYISPAIKQHGYEPDELIGKNPFEFYHPKDAERLSKLMVTPEAIKNNPVFTIRFRKKDGSYIWAEVRNTIAFDEETGSNFIISVSRDISERKQAEQELQKSEANLAQAQQIAHLGSWEWDIEKSIDFWSEEIFRIYGLPYEKSGISYKTFLNSVHPEDRDFVKNSVNAALYEKKPYSIDHRIIRANGEERYVHELGEVVFDKTGKPVKMIGTTQDITERKHAELIQSVLYQISKAVNTTENLDELYQIIHRELGKIIDASNFYIANYNEETGEIIAPYFVDEKFDVKPPVQLRKNGFTEYMIRNKKSLYLTEKLREKLIGKGEIVKHNWKCKIWLGVPLKIEDKIVGGLAVLSYQDASIYTEKDLSLLEFVSDQVAIAIDRKQAKEELEFTNKMFSTILSGLPITVTYINNEGIFTRSMGAGLEKWNIKENQLVGVNVFEAYPHVMDYVKRALNGEMVEFIDTILYQGENHYVYNYLVPDKDQGSINVGLDITEQKRAELIQAVLYQISKAVNTTKNLDELYQIIHHELGKIIDTTNFYIANYNEETGEIISPYFIDEKFDVKLPHHLRKNGVTNYIIKNARSLFLTEELRKRLIREGKITDYVRRSKILLGVPLKIEKKVVGCIVVRSYKEESVFSKKDLSVLEFVSDQVAVAITRKKAEERAEHLNAVLRAIRNVNQLIVQEKDRHLLIKKACRNFIETREFHSAWIALFDDKEKIIDFVEEGLSVKLPKLDEKFLENYIPPCITKTLKSEDVILFRNVESDCIECPRFKANKTRGWSVMSRSLKYDDKFYGIINVTFSSRFIEDKEELSLFNEVAGDIAYALFNMEVEEQRQKAEEKLRESENNLRTLFNAMTDIVFEIDYDGRYINIAPTSPELMFKPSEKVIGKTLHEVFPKPEADIFLAFIRKCLNENKINNIEYPLFINDKTIWFEGRAAPKTKNSVLYIARDITARKKAKEALQESEQLNRTVIENSPIGISVRDKNGTLLLSNRAWQKLWGLSNNEISDYHKPRKKLAFNDKDSYLVDHLDNINKVYKTGGEYYIPELKLSHPKKNKADWISQYFYAIQDEKGNVQRVVILTEDITERKKTTERIKNDLHEKEILLNEIHHRVKNNLQVISSLLKLQEYHIKDKKILEIFRKSENRIRSMALIHQKLYETKDFVHIDFENYIKSLSRMLFGSYDINPSKIRLLPDIQNITFDISRAIPIALILNELVSNSLKYAFPKNEKGEIK
ncbi:MAG TPA: PAS domain S-box protein, partial [Candidatus Cloacimonetes bacterium]|nr:PAS domain S-box protein [Candidatus Cloacimonadota bacterium]